MDPRYPGGESYLDVCARLTPLLPELDRAHNNVIIAHQATLRCLFGFLLKKPAREIPYIKVPLHTVITVKFIRGENVFNFHKLAVECVDTYKPKFESSVHSKAEEIPNEKKFSYTDENANGATLNLLTRKSVA